MKRFLLFAAVCIISLSAIAQKATRTSVANGLFNTATTWDCNCVPVDGDNIVVNTNVSLNLDWGYSSGTLTINPGASLIKDNSGVRSVWISMTGGLINNGTFIVDNLLAHGAPIVNNDSMQIQGWFANYFGFTNNGVVNPVDSISNMGIINNAADGKIVGTHFLNNGIEMNQGKHIATYLLNVDTLNNTGHITASNFQNDGLVNSDGEIDVTINFYSNHHFHNNAAGNLHVTSNFLNADSIMHTCTFYNAGAVEVGSNWMNYDTIQGPSTGHFCVHGNTWNKGKMLGAFDFCDLSNLGSGVVDLNTGTIAPTVTKCVFNCYSGIAMNSEVAVSVYPNPFTNNLIIDLGALTSGNVTIVLSDLQGRQVMSQEVQGAQTVSLNCNDLASGLYIYSIRENGIVRFAGKAIKE
ncbi:MAG: T9SS type A sorting domain-containing protein [Bacteroidota bacterium]